MPYVIRPPRLRAAIAACAAVLLVGAVPAQAGKEVKQPWQCTEPTLYQPFASFGDSNWYALPAGESYNNFTGKGWVLTGGAKFVQAKLQDGTTGYVLDLPANSTATSPNFCLNPDYPNARAMTAALFGQGSLTFYLTYESNGRTPIGNLPTPTGNKWALTPAFSLYPSSTSGWQLGKFTFVAGSNNSEVQVYNFYVDPYVRR
jgi:hypothetical protein